MNIQLTTVLYIVIILLRYLLTAYSPNITISNPLKQITSANITQTLELQIGCKSIIKL